MSIVVYNQPESHSLAYNDNAYVMRSTQYDSTQRFKISVLGPTFPTDPAISTELVYPRRGVTTAGVVTVDRAYYDPSRVLQSQLSTCIAIPSSNHPVYFDCPSMHLEYKLFITEQIKDANGVYQNGLSWISDLKSVWNGGVDKLDWLDFDYTDYDQDAGSDKKFLTTAPSTRYVNTGQSAFLYFLGTQSGVQGVRVFPYSANGTALPSSTATIIQSPLANEGKYGYIAIGPYDIVNSDPSVWTSSPATLLDGAAYYDLFLTGDGSSETIRFYIDQQCTKYTPIRLHWLNRLGGFDAFNFNMKSMVDTDIDRKTYLSEHHTFSGTSWDYNKRSRGQTDYHVGTQRKLTVNTDYLTDAEAVWMEDFATSPVIFQEVNNELIAMSGKPKMIKRQTSLNDKLKQYTFELEYSLDNMRQRG